MLPKSDVSVEANIKKKFTFRTNYFYMHSWSSDISALFSLQGLIGLLTLTVLEIILGIDNIIFISIAVDKLPHAQQKRPGQQDWCWLW